MGKSIDLVRVLNGQPIQFMATIMPSSETAQRIAGDVAASTDLQDDQGQEEQHGQAEGPSHSRLQPLRLWQLEVLHERQIQGAADHGHCVLQSHASTCAEQAAAEMTAAEEPENGDHLDTRGMWSEVLEHRWQHPHGSDDAGQSIYQ